jgi:DNA-binding MarR family transcriptional regulator
MEHKKEDSNKANIIKVESSTTIQPLGKTQRLKTPQKKLRLKQAAKDILHALTIDFLTPKEIASRRKCTLQAVYKVMKKLKQKGLYDSAFNHYGSTHLSIQPLAHQIRLHGQEWNIKLISKSEKYSQSKKRANTVIIDGNTIRLYNDSLEIYSGQSFFEKDENRAFAASLAYWQAFLARLEHEFGAVLIKPRSQNISLVNQHFGETNSEMAKDAIERKQKFRIETDDDGKIWFSLDDSFNFKEMETLHPETSKPDMTKVRKQVNDWRNNDPPTNSELSININRLTENVQGLVQTQTMFDANIKTHFDVLNSIKEAIQELREEVKKRNV